jgi:hypothetical protein
MTEQKILKALWGSPDRPLKIGDLEIPAYVLENGTRVLSGRGMQTALQLGQSHGSKLRKLLSSTNIKPHISNELAMALDTPLRFTRPGRGGVLATGYEATILPDICSAILDARKKEKKLTAAELAVADQCEILTRAFAKVGIIALIDEVTGYQEIRDREALQQILDKFLRKEYAAWAQRFPEEFYREMFRLRNWQWRGMRVNRPSVVAHYTKDLVYQRLAPGILEELERRNPQGERGWRKHKHHQWLTEEIGIPALAQHLYATIGFMRASTTWDQFYRMMQRAFPKLNSSMFLSFPEPEENV